MSLLRGRRAASPIITITGARRTGKTSLLQTALAESGLPHLVINGMAFADVPAIKKADLLRAMERGLNEAVEKQRRWSRRLLEFLRGVRWLQVGQKPPWISFRWERPARELDPLSLVESLDRMASESEARFVLVLDEAQEFRKLVGYRLQGLLAHIYDYMENVQVVVTGSQVGLLHDFLGVEDPEAPLYGRGMANIEVPRLPKELARDFLREGMEQAGFKPDEGVIGPAVDRLDGIIGWLTLFGAEVVKGAPQEEALELAVQKGSRLEAAELEHFLRVREAARRRYVEILRAAARLGKARWVDLKRSLELREGKSLAGNVFNELLQNLCKAGFLERAEGAYSISDPLLAHAVRSGLVK